MSERYKCLFNLHKYCIVLSRVETKHYYGTDEFIKLYCSMCVKSVYAKAKSRIAKRFVVVNTL
jgi:hypothetical protein